MQNNHYCWDRSVGLQSAVKTLSHGFKNVCVCVCVSVCVFCFFLKSSIFRVVWNVRFSSNFTSIRTNNFKRMYGETKLPMPALATAARDSSEGKLLQNLIFWSGFFILPLLMLTLEVKVYLKDHILHYEIWRKSYGSNCTKFWVFWQKWLIIFDKYIDAILEDIQCPMSKIVDDSLAYTCKYINLKTDFWTLAAPNKIYTDVIGIVVTPDLKKTLLILKKKPDILSDYCHTNVSIWSIELRFQRPFSEQTWDSTNYRTCEE